MKKDGMSSRLELGLFTLCRLAKPYSLQLLGSLQPVCYLTFMIVFQKKILP